MTEDKVFVTQEGYNKLQEELQYLKGPKKRKLAKKLKEASEHGDLRENSEFLYTKDELNMVEARIRELKDTLKNAQIISTTNVSTDKVRIGTTVKVKDLEFGDTIDYMIVGSTESDPEEGKIANDTPMGKALLNNKVGDIVKVEVPVGTIEFEILAIKDK
ncbi:transcription elongation factor GreA [Orenia metallireducens]|uniref:Transcription elongation factor GreA n=1 Tax=Orenia metallireducens TaxID=1413210 RepID=A0A285I1U3_9FIRM|nr:transcription elongation factor GreA [Orenia metallireducens]PRX23230.1 transcription elongation factor GreA [Orenia metallireducens]SNY41924.1 transcription elongation factor GreA [Orenia metallireducens]